MQNVVLKVGGIYNRRDGGVTPIIGERPVGYTGPYPFIAENGSSYTKSGYYWQDPSRSDPRDLVEEIVQESVVPVPTKHTPFRYMKEIIEWAKGTLVQVRRQESLLWEDMDPPGKGLYSWSEKNEYRIKPAALLPVTRLLVLTDKGISGGFPDRESIDMVCKDRKLLKILEVNVDQETHSVKCEWKNP